MRRKRNYIIQKHAKTKRVTLPNGRTFLASYKRVKRSDLPPHLVMRKEYRLLQEVKTMKKRTAGTGNFWLYKKSSKNPIVRSVAKKGLEYVPGIYHNLTKRVKNKTLKRILNSNAAHLALNKQLKQQIDVLMSQV